MFIIMETNNLLAKFEESLDTVVLMSMVAREMKRLIIFYVISLLRVPKLSCKTTYRVVCECFP